MKEFRNKETGEIVKNAEISSHLSSGMGAVTLYDDSKGNTKSMYTSEFEQQFEEISQTAFQESRITEEL